MAYVRFVLVVDVCDVAVSPRFLVPQNELYTHSGDGCGTSKFSLPLGFGTCKGVSAVACRHCLTCVLVYRRDSDQRPPVPHCHRRRRPWLPAHPAHGCPVWQLRRAVHWHRPELRVLVVRQHQVHFLSPALSLAESDSLRRAPRDIVLDHEVLAVAAPRAHPLKGVVQSYSVV